MSIKYRGLRRWKYQLMERHTEETQIVGHEYDNGFLTLRSDGVLIMECGYCWDGPSGPTWDTPDSLLGSLVHDAFYQLIRLGAVPRSMRERVDRLFYDLLRRSGMPAWRAWYYWKAVRWFGWMAASGKESTGVIEAP
jgi:hypothetical protein